MTRKDLVGGFTIVFLLGIQLCNYFGS